MMEDQPMLWYVAHYSLLALGSAGTGMATSGLLGRWIGPALLGTAVAVVGYGGVLALGTP